MSNSKLINPKKKRRVFATKESPFPVPIASITGEPPSETQWMYYTGNLVGNQVIVHHSGDISFLYKMVSFCGTHLLEDKVFACYRACTMYSVPIKNFMKINYLQLLHFIQFDANIKNERERA